MISGAHLPWLEDSSAAGYPVWSSWNAQQRSIFILNRDGTQDTTFNMTPYSEDDPEDYLYLMHLILSYRNNGGNQTIRVPEDYPEIQTGIDMSQDGDLIIVDSGTYFEQLNLMGKHITLASLSFHNMANDYLDDTIIDGQGIDRVITIENGENSSTKVIGLTITNGNADIGSGIFIGNSSNPVIEKNKILNNNGVWCGAVGGGIAIMEQSHPKIIGNIIENNSVNGPCDCICYFGGGVYVDSTSFPIVGGEEGLGNSFFLNSSDYGYHLFRQPPMDTTDIIPINARFNTFDQCPPEYFGDVYPEFGWDVSNCYPILSIDDEFVTNSFTLFSAYPNPFNGHVTLSFSLEKDETTQMKVYDLSGKLVDKILNEKMRTGDYTITWDANNYASGVYIVQLNFGDAQVSQKILLLK